jgi:SAM-dependent methyltransferase
MGKYAANRNASIEKLIVKYLKLDELKQHCRILEFGAGKGEFTRRMINRKNIDLLAVETDQSYIKNLSLTVQVFSSIDDVPGKLDCIYLIDVLEHLENDRQFLKSFFEKLINNGRLFVYVPARKELLSSLDKKLGHYRRYSKTELLNKITDAGFTVEVIRYHEILGYFASLFNKWFLGGSGLNKTTVWLYDRILVPLTNIMENFFKVPIGKSIYISAIRNG